MATRWNSKHTGKKIDDTIDYVTNPNLLDNWYFGNPVNQRGQTSYTGAGYRIDRWKSNNSNLTVNLTGNGIVLISGSAAGYLSQYFDGGIPIEDNYTISALVESITGTVYFQTKYSDGTYGTAMKLTTGLNTITIKTAKAISRVLFQVNRDSSVTVKSAKLELGSQQTLAHQDADGNWVLNEIPDYGEQLRRCQRYFLSIRGGLSGTYTNFANGYASSNNYAYVLVYCPVPMRASPAITYKGKFRLSVNGGASVPAVTAIESGANSIASMVRLGVRVASGTAQGNLVMLQADNDETADIYLSADL